MRSADGVSQLYHVAGECNGDRRQRPLGGTATAPSGIRNRLPWHTQLMVQLLTVAAL
jgi:hypothetical protein